MNTLFPRGNLDSWAFSISTYLPNAMNTVMKTVDPVISAALLALTSSSEEFERYSGTVQFEYDDVKLPCAVVAELIYSVPSFKLDNATEDAIAHDKAFILAYLQQIEAYAKTIGLQLDTKKGFVRVLVRVEVGYKV